MSLQIGDIFYADVAYTEDSSKSSNRPVIVIDELEDNILLLISTTSKGEKIRRVIMIILRYQFKIGEKQSYQALHGVEGTS